MIASRVDILEHLSKGQGRIAENLGIVLPQAEVAGVAGMVVAGPPEEPRTIEGQLVEQIVQQDGGHPLVRLAPFTYSGGMWCADAGGPVRRGQRQPRLPAMAR